MGLSLILGALAVAGAGAVAGVGASTIFGGAGGGQSPEAITYEAPFRNYDYQYAPTNVSIDSRQFQDQRSLSYNPIFQIESPYANITKKEAVSLQQQAENTPTATATPTTTQAPSYQEERGTATSSGINPLYILGGALILGGAYYFGQKK